MYKVSVAIEGIAPILYNRFTEEAQENMEAGRSGGKRTSQERMLTAEKLVYRNSDGLYIPNTWLKACALVGATLGNFKYGRRSIYPYLKGGVFFQDTEIPTGRKKPDFIDERMGRIPPKTGAACILRRPGIALPWSVSFTLVVVVDGLPYIQEALIQGGLLSGIGSGRPEFGRFTVKAWEVLKAEAHA